jgi:hypothetical protein
VREILPIDIPAGNFGLLDIVVGYLDRRTVIVACGNAADPAGAVLVQDKNLTLGRSVGAVDDLLTVQF